MEAESPLSLIDRRGASAACSTWNIGTIMFHMEHQPLSDYACERDRCSTWNTDSTHLPAHPPPTAASFY